MGSMNPKVPVRADHRFIQKYITVVLGGKVENVPEEFSLVSKVFIKAGGSWEKVFMGSPEDVELLKKVLKTAYEKGYLTKKYKWEAEADG